MEGTRKDGWRRNATTPMARSWTATAKREDYSRSTRKDGKWATVVDGGSGGTSANSLWLAATGTARLAGWWCEDGAEYWTVSERLSVEVEVP